MVPASSHNSFAKSYALVCMLVVFCGFSFALPGQAQTGPTLDIGTGFSNGFRSGNRESRFGTSITAQVTGRITTRNKFSLLAGLNAAVFVNAGSSDGVACVPPSGSSAKDSCLGDYPDARVFNAQIGLEHQVGNGVAFRFLTGPALYKAWEAHATWGMQSRADVAFHSRSHAAFVLWTQAGAMPIANAPTGVPLLFGLGLRLQ